MNNPKFKVGDRVNIFGYPDGTIVLSRANHFDPTQSAYVVMLDNGLRLCFDEEYLQLVSTIERYAQNLPELPPFSACSDVVVRKCNCDIVILMQKGCQCGAFKKEQEK